MDSQSSGLGRGGDCVVKWCNASYMLGRGKQVGGVSGLFTLFYSVIVLQSP